MATSSASRAGFRAVWRQPALVLAEIAWRWSWGLASLAVLAVSARTFLLSITVTDAEMVELRSQAPVLVADAINRMLEGSGAILARMAAVAVPAMALLWIVTASLGSAAVLKALLPQAGKPKMRTLLGVHFLRAAAALAAILGYMGASIVASRVTAPGEDATPQEAATHLGAFILIFLGLVALVALAWGTVNWYLSLSPVLVVRDGRDAFGALGDAWALVRRHRREFWTVGFLSGMLRLFFMGVLTVVSIPPLYLIGEVPGWVVWAIIVVFTLVYFAVADYLYVARLAAYIDIAERDGLQRAAVSPQVEIAAATREPAQPSSSP